MRYDFSRTQAREFYQILCLLLILGQYQGKKFHQLRHNPDSSKFPCWVTLYNSTEITSQPHLVMSHTSSNSTIVFFCKPINH